MTPSAPARDRPADAFAGYLHRLAHRDDARARADLAEMRRAALHGQDVLMLRVLPPTLIPAGVDEHTLQAYLLTAGLFAVYAAGGRSMPDRAGLSAGRRSLGASARAVNPRRADGDANAGIGSRFSALLTYPFEDLADELRRFLRLLRSHDAPVDFGQLLADLVEWDHPDRPVQRRWAREYWLEPSSSD